MSHKPDLNEGKRRSAKASQDSLIELLVDASPKVELPCSMTLDRIFENAFQEATAGKQGLRPRSAGARIVMSAAFCMCAIAGLLILRSLASERRSDRAVAASRITWPPYRNRIEDRVQPAVRSASNRALAVAGTQRSRRRHTLPHLANRHTPWIAPASPQTDMVTFAILTPLYAAEATTEESYNHSNDRNTESDSILVCIVNSDSVQATAASDNGASTPIDEPISTAPEPHQDPELLLVSDESNLPNANHFTQADPDHTGAPDVLVGTAVGWPEDINGDFAAAVPTASPRLDLTLPDCRTL